MKTSEYLFNVRDTKYVMPKAKRSRLVNPFNRGCALRYGSISSFGKKVTGSEQQTTGKESERERIRIETVVL